MNFNILGYISIAVNYHYQILHVTAKDIEIENQILGNRISDPNCRVTRNAAENKLFSLNLFDRCCDSDPCRKAKKEPIIPMLSVVITSRDSGGDLTVANTLYTINQQHHR